MPELLGPKLEEVFDKTPRSLKLPTFPALELKLDFVPTVNELLDDAPKFPKFEPNVVLIAGALVDCPTPDHEIPDDEPVLETDVNPLATGTLLVCPNELPKFPPDLLLLDCDTTNVLGIDDILRLFGKVIGSCKPFLLH